MPDKLKSAKKQFDIFSPWATKQVERPEAFVI